MGANVSMVETTIDVIPTTIVNLDVAHMESLLETAKHLLNTVKNAFETMIARLNIACFPLVLTIVTVLIARVTMTVWKVLHVWSKTGATCKKNHGCTWWNWNECSEKCPWFQKVTFTCY